MNEKKNKVFHIKGTAYRVVSYPIKDALAYCDKCVFVDKRDHGESMCKVALEAAEKQLGSKGPGDITRGCTHNDEDNKTYVYEQVDELYQDLLKVKELSGEKEDNKVQK